MGQHPNINKSVTPGYYSYKTPGGIIDTTYSITFTPVIYAGSAESYTYSFGDATPNTILTNNSPVTHIFKNTGIYNASLTIGFSTGSVSMSNPITIYKVQPQLWINSITSTVDTIPNASQVNFTASILSGRAPYTYYWSFGDGGTSSAVTTYTTAVLLIPTTLWEKYTLLT